VSFLKKGSKRKQYQLVILLLLFAVMLGVRVYAENTMGYEILVDVEASRLWLFHNGKVEK